MHTYIDSLDDYGISPRYREVLVYLGQKECYAKGSLELSLLLGLKASHAQIHRLSNDYGQRAGLLLEEAAPKWELSEAEVVYAQVDGSMLFTREKGWQEAKIGRTFPAFSCAEVNKDRRWVHQSEYVAHLGKHTAFESKMSLLLDKYEDIEDRLVFISDGAPWIGNWIKAEYPRATMILDIFHAKEYLSAFLEGYFGKKEATEKYPKWSEDLGNYGAETMVQRIEKLPLSNQKAEKAREIILRYYRKNRDRMNYPAYRKRGLQIGSGAIEAAHRTVAQVRLKRSGQRWSIDGAQNILNLRTLNMSGRWDELQELLRAA